MKRLATSFDIRLFNFTELIEEGKTLSDSIIQSSTSKEVSTLNPKSDDICMICYTSGTTGVPKGALITHGNMVAVTTAVIDYIDTLGGFDNTCKHISYLPMAHVFEHFVQSGITWYGARIGFSQGDTSKIVDDIVHLRPTVFASVPRLFNRITDSIFAKVRKESAFTQAIFNHAFKVKVYYFK